jgi:hypothetical protein
MRVTVVVLVVTAGRVGVKVLMWFIFVVVTADVLMRLVAVQVAVAAACVV